MNPLISFIIPVYNVEKYLAQCIESVLVQSHDNIEIILVDDGSTDKSGEICDNFSKTDNRVRVIHQENRGASAARNAGLGIAKGNYIAFIDSDDYVSPSMAEKLLDAISKTDSDLAMCNFAYTDELGKRDGHLEFWSGTNCSKKNCLMAGFFFWKEESQKMK